MAPAQPKDKTLADSPPQPQPRLPPLPEALKGPDCAREVSGQQFYEYMKGSFVQVGRSGDWGLGAGGLPGSEGSSKPSWQGSPQRELGQALPRWG